VLAAEDGAMTLLDPRTEQRLRRGFRQYLNPLMLGMWRLGLGTWFNAWPKLSGRVMVIVHTGRKTGRRRYAPVNYALVDGELYCLAGFGAISDWYRNLMANPQVEVWTPDGWWAGTAEDISECERRLSLMRPVIIGSGIVASLFGFDPIQMTDAELAAATAKYRLLHIHRTQARTGPGGPGDLAWVWPLATLILLPLALSRRRQKER
jgi:deazaflavin-dependent oxidoreductase (nitroreductase family)